MARGFSRGRRRDECGAYAVLFAILSTMLFGVGALAVDLGNGYQRKAETQSQADLAALSAAPYLGTQSTAVAQVLKYLKANTKVGQAGLTAAMLTDGVQANGEVTFPTPSTMKVWTPVAVVKFGLAAAIGPSEVKVSSTATVGVGTPGAQRTMPYYAVQGGGCDYGSQSLTDPANGKAKTAAEMTSVTLAPPVTNPSQVSNKAILVDATPYVFDANVAGTIQNIAGNLLQSVDRVGFFRTTSETPNAVETTAVTNANNNSVSAVALPPTVFNNPGVWWLRVYSNTNGSAKGWTPAANALPIRIGDGPIQCGNLSNSGNFGTLKLPRTGATATWLPDNIALGLELPLSLATMAATNTTQIPRCTAGASGVVYTPTSAGGTRYPNTNCVDTDTGLTALVTTKGLITGTPGRLVGSTTTTVPGRQCGPGHSSATRTMLGKQLNDDTLTCFMTDPSTQLSSIASSTYAGGPVLDPAIYDSPRFVYVPVLGADPSNGGSNHYAVVGMRPGFLTSEANTSTYNAQRFIDSGVTSTTTSTNGLTIPVNKVTTMQVYLFSSKALPSSGGQAQPGAIIDPDGPLVPVLTD